MNGAELAAFYAFPPNRKGYCGDDSFRSALRSYLAGKAGVRVLEKELKRFKVHYAYLSLIAHENGLCPFDEKVVKAFWVGNELLGNIHLSSLRSFIRENLFPAKRSDRARQLANDLPAGVVPHHSLNALYINFVTDRAERSIRNYDSCCITPGKVLSVSGKSAVVERHCIGWKDAFRLGKRKERVSLEKDGIRTISGLKKDDLISIHWGFAVQKLTKKDFLALKRYTLKNIVAINGRCSLSSR